MCAAEILRLVRRAWEDHWGGGQAVARVSGYLVSAGKLVLGRNQTSAFVGGRGLDSCDSAQIPHLHPQKVREWLGGVMDSLEEEAPGSVTTHSGGLSCLVKGGSSQGQQRHGGLRAEDSH